MFDIEVLGDKFPERDRYHASIDLAIRRDCAGRLKDWKYKLHRHYQRRGADIIPESVKPEAWDDFIKMVNEGGFQVYISSLIFKTLKIYFLHTLLTFSVGGIRA